MLLYLANQPNPARTVYYFTGVPEYFTVPASKVQGDSVRYIVAKLWGAGGGGGAKGDGSGGATGPAIGRGAENASQVGLQLDGRVRIRVRARENESVRVRMRMTVRLVGD